MRLHHHTNDIPCAFALHSLLLMKQVINDCRRNDGRLNAYTMSVLHHENISRRKKEANSTLIFYEYCDEQTFECHGSPRIE